MAWAVSGSVGLELMADGLPSVVLYKVKRFDLWIARPFIKAKYISLVNLLADEEVFPEYLTWRDASGELVRWASAWLDDTGGVRPDDDRARRLAAAGRPPRRHRPRRRADRRAAARASQRTGSHRQARLLSRPARAGRAPAGIRRARARAAPPLSRPTLRLAKRHAGEIMTPKRSNKETKIIAPTRTAAPETSSSKAVRPRIEPIHGQKLVALARNRKLPKADKSRVQLACERYNDWVKAMDGSTLEGDMLLGRLVDLLNDYKRHIEIDLIFDSTENFLYRQSGQLKVGNSILEEFLPRLADTRLVPGLSLLSDYKVGPHAAFAAFTIVGNVHTPFDSSVFIK